MSGIRPDTGQTKVGVETTFGTLSSNLEVIPTRDPLSLDGLDQPTYPNGNQRTGNFELAPSLGLKSDSTQTLPLWVHGWSSTTPTKHPVVSWPPVAGTNQCPDATMVAEAIGNYSAPGGGASIDAVVTGTSVGTVKVTDGTKYAVGCGILIDTSATATPKYEAVFVKTVSTNDLVLRAPMSADPADGKSVFGSVTCFPVQGAAAVLGALSIVHQGEETYGSTVYPRDEMYGCEGRSLKLSATARDFLQMDIEYQMRSHGRVDAAAALAYSAYGYPERDPVQGAIVRLYSSGTGLINLECSKIEFDAGLQIRRPNDVTVTGGYGRKHFGLHSPRLVLDPLYTSDLQELAAFEASTEFDVIVQIGTVPGQIVAITMPAAVIIQRPKRGSRDDLLAHPNLTLGPVYYAGDTGDRNNTTPIDAPFAISFL